MGRGGSIELWAGGDRQFEEVRVWAGKERKKERMTWKFRVVFFL